MNPGGDGSPVAGSAPRSDDRSDGRTVMHDYRCYCLDRHGCIRAVTAIVAESDEGARACGTLLLATCAHETAEIWDGRRRVGMVDRQGPNGFGETPRPAPTTPSLRPKELRSVASPAPHSTVQWNRIDHPVG
jgi:hypothetical protein